MHYTYDWQKIYSEHSPKLLGICRRYIPDVYAAEDILQDSFITAMQKGHQLKDEKLLFAWLKKIVINNALQYIRKSSKEIFIDKETSATSLTMSENMEEKTYVLAYDFTREELLSSIDHLPSHHKSVFNLYCIENHSHAEIAEMLGISVNTSKSHLLRAKKSIQNYLVNAVIKPDTPKNKKKMTQLLIFLGFGSLLWAQTFKSKFSEFLLQPDRLLEIPENISIQNISFKSDSGMGWKIKAVAASSLFVIILSSVLIFKPDSPIISKSLIQAESTEAAQNNEKIETETLNQSVLSANNDELQNKEIPKNNSIEQAVVHEESRKLTQNKPKIIVKDSAENIPTKIIVVKKIIQRDTIYVER